MLLSLAYKVSAKKSADSLMGVPCFSLPDFKILSLSLTFVILIMICLGVDHFGFIFFGTLCASLTWISVSIPRLGKFSAIILSNTFLPFSLSLSSPSGTPIMRMLVCLVLSQRSLKLFFLLKTFFFCSSD